MQTFNKTEIDYKNLDGVIFDMDGVVTDTAITHARAWKQLFDEYLKKRAAERCESFRPFDLDSDYRCYVDGIPRYDGVRSFLESRHISLSCGQTTDQIEQETICGLGNRKNKYFLRQLRKGAVTTYDSTVALIKWLRDEGIGTAIISASRNAEEVLKAGGVLGLFDVKVDGVDSDKLSLKGKPEPDIFLEAAKQLEIYPGRAAIVEDSLAGVEAGHRGKFKLVIGVDRTGYGKALKEHGASVVVNDLAEILPRQAVDSNKE